MPRLKCPKCGSTTVVTWMGKRIHYRCENGHRWDGEPQHKEKLAVTDLGRWIVVNAAPTGNSDDVLFCETREDATTVARRFCEQTGRTYYVARAVGKVHRPEPLPVEWEDLDA